jgi:hypothetical protein
MNTKMSNHSSYKKARAVFTVEKQNAAAYQWGGNLTEYNPQGPVL